MKTALFFCVFSALVAPQWATPGGVEKIDDLGSEEVLAAAQAAVDRLNQGSNSLYEMLLVEVLDGTQQVTSSLFSRYNGEGPSVPFPHVGGRWEELRSDYSCRDV